MTTGGATVKATQLMSSCQMPLYVEDNNDGTYHISYTFYHDERKNVMNISINGERLQGNPFKIV